jgi:hypothetical protein
VQARILFVAEVRRGEGGFVVRFQRLDGVTGDVTDTADAPLGWTELPRALRARAADFFATLRGGVVRVLSEPSASEVLVDGERRGTTPQSLKLRAGRHRIEVRHAGHRPFQEEVEVEAGGTVDLDARLPELPREVAVVEPRPAAAGGRLRPATYVTIIAAGLALGAGTALAVLQRQTQTEYNGLDLTHRADVDRRFQLESRGKSLSLGADVAFAVGGAALVVAGVLAYRDLRVRRETRSVRVTVAPGGAAVSFAY